MNKQKLIFFVSADAQGIGERLKVMEVALKAGDLK